MQRLLAGLIQANDRVRFLHRMTIGCPNGDDRAGLLQANDRVRFLHRMTIGCPNGDDRASNEIGMCCSLQSSQHGWVSFCNRAQGQMHIDMLKELVS